MPKSETVRHLTWYIHTLEGDNTSAGPVYTLDREYQPRVVRIHAKRAPDAGDLSLDIKASGTSIFATPLARLKKGQTSEDVSEDFPLSRAPLARYSTVSLDLYPAGAAGITVQLELLAEQDDEMAETNT